MVVVSDAEKISQLQERAIKQQQQIKTLERQLRIRKKGGPLDLAKVALVNSSASENSVGATLHDLQWKHRETELLTRIKALEKELAAEQLKGDKKTEELRSAADQLEVLSNALKFRVSTLGGEGLLPSLLIQIGELQKALSSLRQDCAVKTEVLDAKTQLCESLAKARDDAVRASAADQVRVKELQGEKTKTEEQLTVLTKERKVIIDYLKVKATEREELENEMNRVAKLCGPLLDFAQAESVREHRKQAELDQPQQSQQIIGRSQSAVPSQTDECKETTSLLAKTSALSTALAAERMQREFAEAQVLELQSGRFTCGSACEEERKRLNVELGVLRQRLLVSSKARDLLQEEAVHLEQENVELRRRLQK